MAKGKDVTIGELTAVPADVAAVVKPPAAVPAAAGEVKLVPGMKCPRPRCHGVIRCIASHITKRDPNDGSQWRIQMLQCGSCGEPRPSQKRTIPAIYANQRPAKRGPRD